MERQHEEMEIDLLELFHYRKKRSIPWLGI